MNKPHSLTTARFNNPHPKNNNLVGWIKRHEDYFKEHGVMDAWGNIPDVEAFKKFVKETGLPETQVQACPKRKVADFPEGFIPPTYYEGWNLEGNQELPHCCRSPENHEIEARKSHPDEKMPDIYVFHCTCGREHKRWLVGEYDREGERRPMWK